MDWDFGSSSPARVQVGGHPYFVTIGKSGDVFLIDGEVLGVMYDHKRAAAMCGTATISCPSTSDGLAIKTAATTMEGKPLVVVATYNIDGVNPAGAVAYWVVGAPREPRLEEAWRVPICIARGTNMVSSAADPTHHHRCCRRASRLDHR